MQSTGFARSAVMRINLRCKVRDEHFLEPPSGNLLRGVCKTDLTDAESLEDCADLRHIVERQYELAFQFLQAVRHDHEVVVRKVVAVEGSCVIRRIEVEECLGRSYFASTCSYGRHSICTRANRAWVSSTRLDSRSGLKLGGWTTL